MSSGLEVKSVEHIYLTNFVLGDPGKPVASRYDALFDNNATPDSYFVLQLLDGVPGSGAEHLSGDQMTLKSNSKYQQLLESCSNCSQPAQRVRTVSPSPVLKPIYAQYTSWQPLDAALVKDKYVVSERNRERRLDWRKHTGIFGVATL
jgi:hypothetical protein